MSPHIPTRLAQEVRDRANEVCEYCLLPKNSQEATFHIDHVVPRRQGDFEGLTPTGHATISALGMNRPATFRFARNCISLDASQGVAKSKKWKNEK